MSDLLILYSVDEGSGQNKLVRFVTNEVCAEEAFGKATRSCVGRPRFL